MPHIMVPEQRREILTLLEIGDTHKWQIYHMDLVSSGCIKGAILPSSSR